MNSQNDQDESKTEPKERKLNRRNILLASASFAVAPLFVGCSQTRNTPAPAIAGPMDPNSVTVFTLALQPDSISGCVLSDPSMTRPVTVTVRNDRGELMTDGGIHIDLTRVRPNVYTGNLQMGTLLLQAEANLSVRPKRLTVNTASKAASGQPRHSDEIVHSR